MVFAFFFFGMLETIKTVTHAFDGKIDDFDPQSHLIETEQALFIAFTEGMDLAFAFKDKDENDPGNGDGGVQAVGATKSTDSIITKMEAALGGDEAKGSEDVAGIKKSYEIGILF